MLGRFFSDRQPSIPEPIGACLKGCPFNMARGGSVACRLAFASEEPSGPTLDRVAVVLIETAITVAGAKRVPEEARPFSAMAAAASVERFACPEVLNPDGSMVVPLPTSDNLPSTVVRLVAERFRVEVSPWLVGSTGPQPELELLEPPQIVGGPPQEGPEPEMQRVAPPQR